MKTFKYWAKAPGELVIEGEKTVAQFIGGSDISIEDARLEAIKKASFVQNKIDNHKGRFKDYEVEIREEHIEKINGSTVITRNRYGAHVLNVEDYMILDIDEPPVSIADIFAKKNDEWKIERLKKVLQYLYKKLNKPVLGFRLYQTHKGFRVIVTGEKAGPREKNAQNIARALNTDKLYWFLCKRQNCYRARLTPKPYRMKYKAIHIKFIDNKPPQEEVAAWDAGYLNTAQKYSVCRFIAAVGNNNIDHLVSLHDKYTGANSNKPLA